MKDTEPFAIKSYPVPMKYRDQVSEQIEQMLTYGIIERSTTPFINPLVVVPKKDNSVRLCLDARQINERMVEDHDGSEEIDQVLRRCNKIGVMSSVDLRSSFWQVPLAKESRKYTGFLHQGKTYQYTVVPFGLRISSSALNRAAENVLKGLEKKVIAFVDDWLIISPTQIEEHLQDIDELFTRIEKEGVTSEPITRHSRIFTNVQVRKSRLLRWSLAIQDYRVTFKYIPGRENVLADTLSRIPNLNENQEEGPAIYPILARKPDKTIMRDLRDIKKHQEEDEHLQRLQKTADKKLIKNDEGIYQYQTKSGIKVYLPRNLVRDLITEIHQLYGHVGPRKVTAMILEDFYWPNLIKQAAKILQTCDSCQRNKVFTQPIQGPTQPMLPTRPNELLSIDFIGPFPAGIRDYRYVLVTVDVFTKLTQLYPIVNATCHITFNRIVDDYFKRFGKVEKIQSDRGSQFTSKTWQAAMKNQGVQVIFSAIRHPQSNIVERYTIRRSADFYAR
ncbi:unnamed protein product [Trichogramma brassicae]|uniref:RNA-directed DNA polymerase n=1 Tax=Trichogramma brassicae TaxID=86971 RepID=A0A6H5IY24_9HYME|nr:unnamed protein product [Trichogramma brassicae]